MANKKSDTFPYGLSDEELIAIATKRPQIVERFDTPVCLTSQDKEPVLWAIGRAENGELMVESRYSDETCPIRPFSSFMNHAPDLAQEAMKHSLFLVKKEKGKSSQKVEDKKATGQKTQNAPTKPITTTNPQPYLRKKKYIKPVESLKSRNIAK
jgi:hypothetical protein